MYDAAAILDLERVTLSVDRPASVDPIVSQLGDADRLAWMHANFTDHALVSELGDARATPAGSTTTPLPVETRCNG